MKEKISCKIISSAIILNGSCIAYEYLDLFSTQIHIRQEARNWCLKIFKHFVGSLVDPFNSCQLHISYTKYVKLFFKVFLIREKVCRCLPGDMKGGGIMKKVTNGDIRGSKIWYFSSEVIFEMPQIEISPKTFSRAYYQQQHIFC